MLAPFPRFAIPTSSAGLLPNGGTVESLVPSEYRSSSGFHHQPPPIYIRMDARR